VGYVERHLLPRERLLYTTRLHWGLFAKPVLAMIAGVILTWMLYARVPDPPWLWQVGVLLAASGVLWLVVRWIEWETSEFAVTSVRLIFKVGLVARYTTELLLSKVESISVTQGPIGRVMNYGDLTVTGTGAVREVFPRVHDPVGFRNAVQHASAARPVSGE
jgi:membrane protein YdbS with pleckstrin-like domain